MLCISIQPGEYFTVGDQAVIQFDRLNGQRAHLTIHAPREIPVVRGEVLERQGGQRPACVADAPPHYVRQLPWDHKKKQALAELRQRLAQLGDSADAQAIRDTLNRIFPQPRQDGG